MFVCPCRCATSKTCYTNEGSTSATRQCGSGSTGLVRCLFARATNSVLLLKVNDLRQKEGSPAVAFPPPATLTCLSEPRCVTSASAKGRKPVAGRTIARRVRICHFGDESARCCGPAAYERYKSLHPFTPQSSTISTRNPASPADRTSRPTVPPLSPNGVNFAPPDQGGFGQPETSSHWSDSTYLHPHKTPLSGAGLTAAFPADSIALPGYFLRRGWHGRCAGFI